MYRGPYRVLDIKVRGQSVGYIECKVVMRTNHGYCCPRVYHKRMDSTTSYKYINPIWRRIGT